MEPKPKNFVNSEKTKHHAEILSNRVRNRYRHLSRKFKRQNIDCFRLYDWDIPEVRAVVDWYAGHLVVAEYERLQTGPQWLPQMAEAVFQALGVPSERTHIKRRRTKTEDEPRYSKMPRPSEFLNVGGVPPTFGIQKGGRFFRGQRFEVRERDLRFWINLEDFLDTGLYSDHRDTRVMIGELAKGQDFLNLFAYTGAFTCAAAAGGAKTTTTVDRSETYQNWAKDNLQLNKLSGPQHTFVQSNVSKFLAKAEHEGRRFTLAFVDPPSFFQDQTRKISFDVNEDHPELIQNVLKVMTPGSLVFFSTNHQRFEPNLEGLPVKDLVELTPKTIPEDYRNRKVHRCWQMTVL